MEDKERENINFLLQELADSKRELMRDLEEAHLLNLRNIALFKALFGELQRLDPSAIDRVRAHLDKTLIAFGDEESFGKMIKTAHQIVGLQGAQ